MAGQDMATHTHKSRHNHVVEKALDLDNGTEATLDVEANDNTQSNNKHKVNHQEVKDNLQRSAEYSAQANPSLRTGAQQGAEKQDARTHRAPQQRHRYHPSPARGFPVPRLHDG
ncbi:hypothetical protein L4D09_14215 [Photobacterium makurazakiensis]|uniref:hypothetical protein n=1 Tax=Photobacterium makurazakiensis TaxID=2910234 RepID=UPI003D14C301